MAQAHLDEVSIATAGAILLVSVVVWEGQFVFCFRQQQNVLSQNTFQVLSNGRDKFIAAWGKIDMCGKKEIPAMWRYQQRRVD